MQVREAALIPAAVAALIQFVLPFVTNMTQPVAAAVNGGLAFVAAVVTAFLVSAEKGMAFLAGAGNTIIQLAAGFGITMTDMQQAALATFLTMLAAAYTRTQVVAPVSIARTAPQPPVQRAA